MKLNKYLLLIMLSICICPGIVMASSLGSIRKQAAFRDKALELLKQQDLDALKDYVDSIPDCNLSYNVNQEQINNQDEIASEGNALQEIDEEESAQEFVVQNNPQSDQVCTMDRIDGKAFLYRVWQKGVSRERFRFDLIETDAGLYDSLGNYYRFLYNAEPRNFNIKFYRDFYNRFRDTWLQSRVELVLTNLWQPGTIYRKWSGFSAMTGKNIYTTLYVSWLVGIDICKYIDPEIKMDKYIYGGGRDRLRTILREMKQKSEETNTPELLRYIKRLWYHSISYNESDEAEKEYYQGKKHTKKYELLSDGGWDMFSDVLDGLTGETLRREKHNIKVDIWNCVRITEKPELCESFEQGAIKNGFYTAPIEYVEPSIEEKLQEMQNQINEKLFMYK